MLLKHPVLKEEYKKNYLVLAAMRGPDPQGDLPYLLKIVVTARLRGLVFSKKDCKGWREEIVLTKHDLRRVLAAFVDEQNRGAKLPDTVMNQAMTHFVEHLIQAVRVTQQDPVWGGIFPQLESLLYMIKADCGDYLYGAPNQIKELYLKLRDNEPPNQGEVL